METSVQSPTTNLASPRRLPRKPSPETSTPLSRETVFPRADEAFALRLNPDGTEEAIPLTREILLNPCLEIKIVQSPPHSRKLKALIKRLDDFVHDQGLELLDDVGLRWPNERTVSPDLSVIEGLREREPGEEEIKSVDVAAEGCRVRTVFEVVSADEDDRWKDEEKNPPLFARRGVEDCVLVYPPTLRKPTDRPIRVLSDPSPSGYKTEQKPDPEGFYPVRSLGLRIGVEITSGGREEIVLLDAATGQRLTDRKEESKRADTEAEARRKAEQEKQQEAERADAEAERAEEANAIAARLVITVLEKRGLDVDDAVRRRILACRGAELDHLTERAWDVGSARELFEAPIV